MKNITSFENVFLKSNFYFFTSFPNIIGIFSSEKKSKNGNNSPNNNSNNNINNQRLGNSDNKYDIKIEKIIDLSPLQIDSVDGTSGVSYVPLPVRTFKCIKLNHTNLSESMKSDSNSVHSKNRDRKSVV